MPRALPALLIAAIWLTPWAAAVAQPAPLTVVVRDEQGSGVPGLVVALRPLAGGEPSRAVTGADGAVRIAPPAADAVRLRVTGLSARGAPVAMGSVSFIDDMSLRVNLGVGEPVVPLILAADGMVYLDPGEFAAEGSAAGGGAGAPPTPAAFPTLVPLPTAAVAAATAPAGAGDGGRRLVAQVVGALLAAGALAALTLRGRRRP